MKLAARLVLALALPAVSWAGDRVAPPVPDAASSVQPSVPSLAPLSAALSPGADLRAAAPGVSALAVPAGPAALAEPASSIAAPAQARPATALPPAAAGRGPPQAQGGVDEFLSVASQGDSPQARAWVSRLPAIFDGASPEDRERLIDRLEGLAVADKKGNDYRRALQGFVVRDELSRIEPKLREAALTPRRESQVAAQTEFHDVRWRDHFFGEVTPVPDGIARPDRSITLNVRGSWRSLPSFVDHIRILFTHEYTHRLQFEGEYSSKLGPEPSAVSSELLRALELAGLNGLKDGALPLVSAGMLQAFEWGRAWTRGEKADDKDFFFKGYLAGAAYELAERTGRWDDAWAFHRAVSRGEDPRQAAARIASGASAER